MLDGEFSQHFAVDLNVLLFHQAGKFAPGGAVFAKGGIRADKPEGAEVAFFVAAVPVGVGISLEQRLAGMDKVSRAAVIETFGSLDDILSAFVGGYAAFDSGHMFVEANLREVDLTRIFREREFASISH